MDYSNDDGDNAAFFHRAMLTDQTIEEMEQQVSSTFNTFFCIYRLNHINHNMKKSK